MRCGKACQCDITRCQPLGLAAHRRTVGARTARPAGAADGERWLHPPHPARHRAGALSGQRWAGGVDRQGRAGGVACPLRGRTSHFLQRARSDSVAQPSRRQPPRATRVFPAPRGRLAGTPGRPGPHRPCSHGPGTRSRKPPARMGPGARATRSAAHGPATRGAHPPGPGAAQGLPVHGSKLARSTGPRPAGVGAAPAGAVGRGRPRPRTRSARAEPGHAPGRMAAAFANPLGPQPHQRRVGAPAGSECAVDQPLPADRCRRKRRLVVAVVDGRPQRGRPAGRTARARCGAGAHRRPLAEHRRGGRKHRGAHHPRSVAGRCAEPAASPGPGARRVAGRRHGRCCPASPPRRAGPGACCLANPCAAGGPAAPGCGRGGADPAPLHDPRRPAAGPRAVRGRPHLGRAGRALQPALGAANGARVGLPAHARTGPASGVGRCAFVRCAPLAAHRCAGAGGAGR